MKTQLTEKIKNALKEFNESKEMIEKTQKDKEELAKRLTIKLD